MSQELLGVADPYRLYYQKINANFEEVYGDISDINDLIGGGQAKMEDGTAADPAYTFAADVDTGIYRPATNELAFSTGGTYRGKFNATGTLLIGKSASDFDTAGPEISPTACFVGVRDSNPALQINRLGTDGAVAVWYKAGANVGNISVTGPATAYNTSSDGRLKQNIEDAPSQWEWLQSVQVREFEFKAEVGRRVVGVIAQEHVLVSPDAITTGDDGPEITEQWGSDPSKDVYRLLKACQEMAERIEALEQQVGG
jgi:hypothetical protein